MDSGPEETPSNESSFTGTTADEYQPPTSSRAEFIPKYPEHSQRSAPSRTQYQHENYQQQQQQQQQQQDGLNQSRTGSSASNYRNIPLTGDSETDANIMAFVRARQALVGGKKSDGGGGFTWFRDTRFEGGGDRDMSVLSTVLYIFRTNK